MSVTEQLLRLHTVESQIRQLRSRIDQAERYLQAQDAQLEKLAAQREAVAAQLRQLEATAHNREVEISAVDEKIAKLREQLNSARTNKEYSAILTEVNTLKADRDQVESSALEAMTEMDGLRQQIEELDQQSAERRKIRKVAQSERDEREQEVKDKLDELQRERAVAAADVPPDVLAVYEELVEFEGDDAMAALEEHSRKNMEYACSACQYMMPMEVVSVVLGKGDLTLCVNCGVILYMEDALRDSMIAGRK